MLVLITLGVNVGLRLWCPVCGGVRLMWCVWMVLNRHRRLDLVVLIIRCVLLW